ncbi:hypothetical protein ACFL96_17455 [Thermoproteota archaeon]
MLEPRHQAFLQHVDDRYPIDECVEAYSHEYHVHSYSDLHPAVPVTEEYYPFDDEPAHEQGKYPPAREIVIMQQ